MLPLNYLLFLQIIIFLFITPGTPRILIISYSINYGVENNLTTLEEAEAYFNFKNYVFQSSLGGLAMGIVTSAIVAIFFRKKVKVEN